MTERFAGYVSLDAYCADMCLGAKTPEDRASCERGWRQIEIESWIGEYWLCGWCGWQDVETLRDWR